MRWIAIATGGALGAVLRYAVSGWAQALGGTRFPWGTLVVNATGSFVLGFVMAAALAHAGEGARAFLAIGLLGAFTTFSTFSYETLALVQVGDWALAGLNVAAHLGLGLGAALLGLWAGSVA